MIMTNLQFFPVKHLCYIYKLVWRFNVYFFCLFIGFKKNLYLHLFCKKRYIKFISIRYKKSWNKLCYHNFTLLLYYIFNQLSIDFLQELELVVKWDGSKWHNFVSFRTVPFDSHWQRPKSKIIYHSNYLIIFV